MNRATKSKNRTAAASTGRQPRPLPKMGRSGPRPWEYGLAVAVVVLGLVVVIVINRAAEPDFFWEQAGAAGAATDATPYELMGASTADQSTGGAIASESVRRRRGQSHLREQKDYAEHLNRRSYEIASRRAKALETKEAQKSDLRRFVLNATQDDEGRSSIALEPIGTGQSELFYSPRGL